MASGASQLLPKGLQPHNWVPHLSVMDRYIGVELILPFLFGVGAFSSLGVSVGALFDLIRRVSEYGLPFQNALEILLLKTPEFISYAFPMSVLLATLMTYSRLSSDSELTALKGCGVSVYRMIIPAVVLSLVVTGLAFVFNEVIVPAANYRASETLERALGRDQYPDFQKENILYQEFQQIDGDGRDEVLTRLFYASRFDGKEMYGLTVLDFTQAKLNQITSAESAVWNFTDQTWDFFNGTIYLVSSDGSYSNILKFQHQQVHIPRTPLDIASSERQDPREMNLAESWERVRLLRQRGSQSRLRRLLITIHEKYALPFACVVFGLVGAALGSQLRRTGRATSFAISIVIIFSYYLLYSIFSATAHASLLPPILSAWVPNIFGFCIGIFLLVRAAR